MIFRHHLVTYLEDSTPEEIAKLFADQLTALDPKAWIQSIGHSFEQAGVALIIYLLIIIVLYLLCIKPQQSHLAIMWRLLL